MKKSIIILLHCSYWFVYVFLVFLYFQASRQNQTGVIFPGWIYLNVFGSSAFVPALLSFYIFNTFLFLKFLKQKKILYLILSGILVCFIVALIEDVYLSITPGPGIFAAGMESAIGITLMLFALALVNGIMGLILKAFIIWYCEIKLKEELSKKNYETELALVKSQINPHFLFNTINNIDTLIEIDAAKASQYLNKLSEIMRFMLYESKTEKLPIEKELHYIERYIDLQKIRTVNEKFVNFAITGDTSSIVLESMLFIPFIENAFKYAENIETENAINIYFSFEKEKITFKCENKYETTHIANATHSGLGNELIKKRLSLLFPKTHVLDVYNSKGIYTVNLIITQYEN